MDFQQWKEMHPKTIKVASNYSPKKEWKCLTDHQLDLLLWILYKYQSHKKNINKLWNSSKQFLYMLVSHRLKELTPQQISDWYGFNSIEGYVWNKLFKNNPNIYTQTKYPVIYHKDFHKKDKCLCGVKIQQNYYCWSKKLKITFCIGSRCAGWGAGARFCIECGKREKRMTTKGTYKDNCKSCKSQKESLIESGVPEKLIGKCIDCKKWVKMKYPGAKKCLSCYHKIDFIVEK